MGEAPEATFTLTGVRSLLELLEKVQRQAYRKVRDTIAADPENAGYNLRAPLHKYRGIHTGRYRIIWRNLRTSSGKVVPRIIYVGKRAEGDEEDAYAEIEKLLGFRD